MNIRAPTIKLREVTASNDSVGFDSNHDYYYKAVKRIHDSLANHVG